MSMQISNVILDEVQDIHIIDNKLEPQGKITLSNMRTIREFFEEDTIVRDIVGYQLIHNNIHIDFQMSIDASYYACLEVGCGTLIEPKIIEYVAKRLPRNKLQTYTIKIRSGVSERTVLYLIDVGCRLDIQKECVTNEIVKTYFEKHGVILELPDSIKPTFVLSVK